MYNNKIPSSWFTNQVTKLQICRKQINLFKDIDGTLNFLVISLCIFQLQKLNSKKKFLGLNPIENAMIILSIVAPLAYNNNNNGDLTDFDKQILKNSWKEIFNAIL